MTPQQRSFDELFRCGVGSDGRPSLSCTSPGLVAVVCPTSGHPLRVSTIQTAPVAICPACARRGSGAFVSFEADLRLAYACPACRQLVWVTGA